MRIAVPGSVAPTGLPRIHDIGINLPVLLFTLGMAVVAGLLIGLIPVFKFAGGQLNTGLREGGRFAEPEPGAASCGSTLVMVQVALALVLLICSGLMIRTFRALEHVNPRFYRSEYAAELPYLGAGHADSG